MTNPLPTTLETAEPPQMAVLHVLHAAIRAAENALVAAHPELEEYELPSLSAVAQHAELLLTQIAGMDTCIGRYTTKCASGLFRVKAEPVREEAQAAGHDSS